MPTVRTVFRGGSAEPLEPANLPEHTHVTVALLSTDDPSADAIAELACTGEVVDFLNEPREDLDCESDAAGAK